MNKLLREAQAADSDDDQEIQAEDFEEWNGIEEEKNEVLDFEDEYIDEDKYTTVKVEAVSVSKDGFEKLYDSDDEKNSEDEAKESKKRAAEEAAQAAAKKKQWPKKEKKAKFRYEQKLDRQNEARKQRAKKKARYKSSE